MSIGVKYGMIFVPVFLICHETHFGAPLRFRKGWVISFQSNPSTVFDQGVNKKINKHSRFDASFKIRCPVQMNNCIFGSRYICSAMPSDQTDCK